VQLDNVGVFQALHNANFLFQCFKPVFYQRSAPHCTAARSTRRIEVGEGASTYFYSEEAAACILAKFDLRSKVTGATLPGRIKLLRDSKKLTFPKEPLPKSLIGVYVSLKPIDRALNAPNDESRDDNSSGLIMLEVMTCASATELNKDDVGRLFGLPSPGASSLIKASPCAPEAEL
jgi:hypothetical protein